MGGNALCTVTFNATTIDIDVDLIAKSYALGITKGATTTVASTDVMGYVVKLNANNSRGSRIRIVNRTALTDYFTTRVSKSGIAVDVSHFVTDAVNKAVDEGKAQAKSEVAASDNKKYTTVNDGSTSEGVPAISLSDSHSFVHLESALGIKHFDPDALTYLQLSDLAVMSPFDQVYCGPNENIEDLKSTSGWFASEVNLLFDK